MLVIVLRYSVWTCPGAVSATHAFGNVYQYDSVRTDGVCVRRANTCAFGMVTVVAGQGKVISKNAVFPGTASGVPFSTRNLNYTAPQYPDRELIFIFASFLAGFTTGTGACIKGECVTHTSKYSLLRFKAYLELPVVPHEWFFQFLP